jgi:uncharacterized lipoprotein YddW (UPF0748 family)
MFLRFMPCKRPPRGARSTLAVLTLVLLVCTASLPVRSRAAAADDPASEIRALWVLRTSLTSADAIAALVKSAHENGFNTLLVQVRGRGDAYYNGGVEPRAAELQRQPDTFDPLAAVLEAAHAAGLRVHAWVNVNLVSSAVDLPIASTHVVRRHPEWLMVPRAIAQDLAAVPSESPAYIGKLARWTRSESAEIEGLYTSPLVPAAVDHLQSVVRDLTTRYAVDGVHFDYARYPSASFDYSRAAIAEFRASVRPRLAEPERAGLDARSTVDLFAYPDALPDDWRAFRVSRMTALLARLRSAVKTARPDAIVTVATAPDLREAYERRLQDWGAWLTAGIVDAVCPMAYSPEPERFAEQIAAARAAAGTHPVWAGIGAYRLTPSQTIENIQTARRLGAAGIVLFSYDSLVDARVATPDYLAAVGRGAFAAGTASAGSR